MEKRIDLTQFEGITKGPWEFPLLSGTLVTAYPHPTIVKYEDEEADCRLRLGEINCPYDGRAIAKTPDLIAELKRCYDLIDCLEDEMKFALTQLHLPIDGGWEWYEVRENIIEQLVTNANSSTIRVLEALEQSASE